MSNDNKELVTREERFAKVSKWLRSDAFIGQLAVAAPRGVQPDRLARICLTTYRESEKLQLCSQQSLLAAVMICCQTGLEPGPIGHAAIVPYKGNAQWQAMYKGLLHLAYRSEQVIGIQCEVVYETDEFDWEEGSKPFVHHKRDLRPERLKSPKIAAYCSLTLRDGQIVRILPYHEVMEIRKRYSKTTRDDAPWITEEDEMICKTVAKRTLKRAPLCIEAKAAIGYDDLADVGKHQSADLGDLSFDDDPPPNASDYCNKPIGDEGLVCCLIPRHQGECAG